ncbi:DUF72 domain-containing protein [Frigidibacter oleivorans]|uniref:DUF72 domain-containing protein n=1 Tax=Frigidibacter oleivorans TaxID=2487129 RepID=UPI000F8F5421|nr:DUF72 domain-containing protein [Frigidibacter oleivorans]
MAGRIRIGIGGWVFPEWRDNFYPKGLVQARELEYAAGRLTAIEINGTFYRTPSDQTFRDWHDAVPEGFVFAVKAPRYATNRKVLAEAGDSVGRFMDSGLRLLGDRLGPVNWQFAPTKRFDRDDFAAFLDLLPDRLGDRPLRHAVEVRHESFLCAEFVDLCRDRGIAVVTAGDSDHPQIADATAPFHYARIMGTTEEHPAGYGPQALDRWAARAGDWAAGRRAEGLNHVTAEDPAAGARDVFLFVISGAKARNPAAALALIERVGSR